MSSNEEGLRCVSCVGDTAIDCHMVFKTAAEQRDSMIGFATASTDPETQSRLDEITRAGGVEPLEPDSPVFMGFNALAHIGRINGIAQSLSALGCGLTRGRIEHRLNTFKTGE